MKNVDQLKVIVVLGFTLENLSLPTAELCSIRKQMNEGLRKVFLNLLAETVGVETLDVEGAGALLAKLVEEEAAEDSVDENTDAKPGA